MKKQYVVKNLDKDTAFTVSGNIGNILETVVNTVKIKDWTIEIYDTNDNRLFVVSKEQADEEIYISMKLQTFTKIMSAIS